MAGMIKSLNVKGVNTSRAVERGYLLATDLADYLVRKGESFRKAHDSVGRLVSYMTGSGKSFGKLSLSEYRRFSPRFDEDVYTISVASSLAARDIPGGTAPKRVSRALVAARKKLAVDSRMQKKR